VKYSAGDRMKVVGDLTIRDVSREVVLDVRYKAHSIDGAGSHRAIFEGETEPSREEFGIDWGGNIGRTVIGDAVSVRLYLEAVKQGDYAV
jgi:polyisoprenoid-binding protein YceI